MIFDVALTVALIGSFFFYIPTRMDGGEIWVFQSLSLLAILSLWVKRKRSVSMLPLTLLGLWATLTTLYHFQWPVRGTLINLVIGLLGLRAIVECSNFTKRKLGIGLLVTTVIQLILLTIQLQHKEGIYQPVYYDPAGSFLVPWALGCFALLATPYVCSLNLVYILGIIPLFIISKSWTCMLASSLVFSWVFREKHPDKFYLAILIAPPLALATLIASVILGYGHHMDMARIFAWMTSYRYIHNLWTGNGLGTWAHEAFVLQNGKDWYHWRWAHNEFYQQFFEQGRVGLALAFLALLTMFRKAKSAASQGGLMSLCFCAMVHPVLHWGNLVMISLVTMAMPYIEHYQARQPKAENYKEVLGYD